MSCKNRKGFFFILDFNCLNYVCCVKAMLILNIEDIFVLVSPSNVILFIIIKMQYLSDIILFTLPPFPWRAGVGTSSVQGCPLVINMNELAVLVIRLKSDIESLAIETFSGILPFSYTLTYFPVHLGLVRSIQQETWVSNRRT